MLEGADACTNEIDSEVKIQTLEGKMKNKNVFFLSNFKIDTVHCYFSHWAFRNFHDYNKEKKAKSPYKLLKEA